MLAGPFYQPLGVFTGEPPTAAERAGLVEVHRAGRRPRASRLGLKLSVEPLNRFECYVLNTVADAAAIVRRVGLPNYGLLYDTFHANIEEKDPVGVIAPHLAQINHVHVSENDRGTPGKGHVPFAGHLQGVQGRRLRRLVRHRGLRPRAAGAGRRHPRLARLLPPPRGGLPLRPRLPARGLGQGVTRSARL